MVGAVTHQTNINQNSSGCSAFACVLFIRVWSVSRVSFVSELLGLNARPFLRCRFRGSWGIYGELRLHPHSGEHNLSYQKSFSAGGPFAEPGFWGTKTINAKFPGIFAGAGKCEFGAIIEERVPAHHVKYARKTPIASKEKSKNQINARGPRGQATGGRIG